MKAFFIPALIVLLLLSFAESQAQASTAPAIKLSYIDSLLLKPFDIYKFKKKMLGSLSSGAKRKAYYFFKPEYKGIYFAFYLFQNLQEYLADRKDHMFRSKGGLDIITYKPEGKYQDQYLDPNEELVEVITRCNNLDMPQLAFVGLDSNAVIHKLGSNYQVVKNCMLYTHNNRALVLGLNGKNISWLKYVHLKTEIFADEKALSDLCTEVTVFME